MKIRAAERARSGPESAVGRALAVRLGACLLSCGLAFGAGGETAGKATVAGRKAAVKQQPASRGTAKRAHRRSRRSNYRWRISRLKMEPQRIDEIQTALKNAGYYRGEPNGKWDDATRDAMRRYQSANGFPTTGLPDAKSLMKLGLGPHSLPDAVDPMSQARLGGASQAEPGAGKNPPAPQAQPDVQPRPDNQ